jgi:putative transcriptional regulator
MTKVLREKIAGEITISNNPGSTIKKWRTLFNISQRDLAEALGISTSVISDYEAGRRQSPGVATVRKMVDALLVIEVSRGGTVLKKFDMETGSEAIIGMGEFQKAIPADEFITLTEGVCHNQDVAMERTINGYTLIDSLKAITTFSSSDYLKIYGWSTERALFFTGVKHGRSPMVAVRAHPMKPAMVIYVRPENVDELAIRLASLENIILLTTDLSAIELLERFETLRWGT